MVNITNPTPYSATIPYVDIHILKNGSLLGHATVRDLNIVSGRNDRLHVVAVYDPLTSGGRKALAVGRDLISQYISGYNTSITLQTHEGTIPSLPGLGRAFSKFAIDIPTPHLKAPERKDPGNGNGGDDDGNDDDDDVDKPHFIEDAIMHLFSSTATFTLLSPLKHTTLTITNINATALYNDTYGDISEVGHILYDLPFDVPPIDKDGFGVVTPRLPVDWSLGSVGYDAVRNALGGKLKVGAFAHVGLKIGQWQDQLWYRGKGIGAKIRI